MYLCVAVYLMINKTVGQTVCVSESTCSRVFIGESRILVVRRGDPKISCFLLGFYLVFSWFCLVFAWFLNEEILSVSSRILGSIFFACSIWTG